MYSVHQGRTQARRVVETYVRGDMQMPLVWRHPPVPFVPVVVLTPRREPVGLVREHLRGDARAHRDRVYFCLVHRAGLVELLEADVRARVLQVRLEVLVLEHGAGKVADVEDGDEVCARDDEDERSDP